MYDILNFIHIIFIAVINDICKNGNKSVLLVIFIFFNIIDKILHF